MGLKNWSLSDARNFLLACGFYKLKNSASGSAISYTDGRHVVQLHFHGQNEVKGYAVMKGIVENSGIPEKFWTKEKRIHRNIKKDVNAFWRKVEASIISK